MSDAPHIRRARPDEAAVLSALAYRSKAYWGYTAAFMAACRAELTYDPAAVGSLCVGVAERRGTVVGFYALGRCRRAVIELEALFVDPGHIGTGCGTVLLRDAVAQAARLGAHRLFIQSDPHAVGFYRAAGAVQVGERPSSSMPGRRLPLLFLALDGAASREAG
jgi:GNAT superfamily N-acetyltransferase